MTITRVNDRNALFERAPQVRVSCRHNEIASSRTTTSDGELVRLVNSLARTDDRLRAALPGLLASGAVQ